MRNAIVVLALVVSACSSAAPNVAPSPAVASAPKHQPGRLTRAELAGQSGRKLGDAIRAIDAGMLMARAEPLEAWLDGIPSSFMMIESLSANDVQEVRRVSAMDARQLFGDRANGAGLVVLTRKP